MTTPVRSCGVLIFRQMPHPIAARRSFLLMKHPDRWDLPKGHVDPGESDMTCALRELWEETGIEPANLRLDEDFQFEHRYLVRDRAFPDGPVEKTLRVFLGWLTNPEVAIRPTEHEGFTWFDWNPPHLIQARTIDPLLAAVERHFQIDGRSPSDRSPLR